MRGSICITIATAAAWSFSAQASQNCAADTHLLEHSFTSGASWSVCAKVDENHGLHLQSLHYRAPGDSLRKVLHTLHAGQILMHYHDASQAQTQLGDIYSNQQRPTGESLTQTPSPYIPVQPPTGSILAMNDKTCNGEIIDTSGSNRARLCSRILNNGTLAKYSQNPSLHSSRWQLTAALQRSSLVWSTTVSLSEDGSIQPAIGLSGRARHTSNSAGFASPIASTDIALTRATVVSTWRMVFDLDSNLTDQVYQFDFALDQEQGNRRPMRISEIASEEFRRVSRENFRGWQVQDSGGSGYYLDPGKSGFDYRSSAHNWANYDLAISRYAACERYAANNTGAANLIGPASSTDETGPVCASSLDEFVNAQSLSEAHPVLWYSQSRSLNPSNEDWPVIRHFHLSFQLMPFEWTSASPFEPAG